MVGSDIRLRVKVKTGLEEGLIWVLILCLVKSQ